MYILEASVARRILTVSEARRQLPTLVREVSEGRGPVLVGPRGRPAAMLVDPDEYERLERIVGTKAPAAGWAGLRLEVVGSPEELDQEWGRMRAERSARLDALYVDESPRSATRSRARRSR